MNRIIPGAILLGAVVASFAGGAGRGGRRIWRRASSDRRNRPGRGSIGFP